MTDLELIKKCADRMGLDVVLVSHKTDDHGKQGSYVSHAGEYDPLHDDAQAMELVKKFKVCLVYAEDEEHEIGPIWQADIDDEKYLTTSDNLNRAICECVAKLEK